MFVKFVNPVNSINALIKPHYLKHFPLFISGDVILPKSLPPVSTHSETITTATPTTTSVTSDVIVTSIVVTTTSCGVPLTSNQLPSNQLPSNHLPSNNLTTTSVTVTTAHTTLNTSCSNSHQAHQFHQQPHPQQQYHHHHQSQQQPQQIQHHQSHIAEEKKYSPHYNNQQKVIETHVPDSVQSVIKRCPPTPPHLNKPSQPPSPVRHKTYRPSPVPPQPSLLSSSSSVTTSQLSAPTPSYASNSVISRETRRVSPSPSRSRTPRREESRDRDPYQVLPPSIGVSKSSFFSQPLPG